MPSVAIVLLAVLALAVPGRAAVASTPHDRWRRPLPGAAVARTFSFDPAAPYQRGRRRGIDLRARPGTPVRAVCTGTVTHAGRVPRRGLGVTLRCGRLVATELGIVGPAVRRGGWVRAGAVLGRLGPRGVLRLGARRAGARQGYLDPLALLGGAEPSAPAAPPAVAPRPPSLRAPVRPPHPPRPAPAVTRSARPAPTRLPWPAWAGLGLLAAGAGGGTMARRRRGRRTVTGAVVAHRYR